MVKKRKKKEKKTEKNAYKMSSKCPTYACISLRDVLQQDIFINLSIQFCMLSI